MHDILNDFKFHILIMIYISLMKIIFIKNKL